jgi:hypothetical protein
VQAQFAICISIYHYDRRTEMTAVIEDMRSINFDLINRIGSLEDELIELKKRVPQNKVSIILL